MDVMSCGRKDANMVFEIMEKDLEGTAEIILDDLNVIGGE